MDCREILRHFSIEADSILLVTDNMEKPVWRVTSGQDDYYLKQMPLTRGYLQFLTGALEHLAEHGVRLPELMSTTSNERVLEDQGKFFILTRGVPGESPEYEDHLELIVREMARFHKASLGYTPAPDSEPRNLAGTWADHYQNKYEQLTSLKEQAATRSDPFSVLFLEHADTFLTRMEQAANRLTSGVYQELCDEFSRNPSLCHQDFTASNLLLTPEGQVVVLDWDSLAYDIPARDLRKLLTKLLKKGEWSPEISTEVLTWYSEEYPLSSAHVEVLAADLEFPHQFVSMVAKYYAGRTEDWSERKCLQKLQNAIMAEENRLAAAGLIRGAGGV